MDATTSIVTTTNLISAVAGLVIFLVLPILAAIVLIVRKKIEAFPFFAGAAAFFVSQIMLRMPLLQSISAIPAFSAWVNGSSLNYLLYLLLIGGLSAAWFEETARFAGAKALKHRTTYRDMISFGLGHGLCEVVALIGLTYINNLLLVLALLQPDGALAAGITGGLDAATLTAIAQSLSTLTPVMVAVAVIERISAVLFHMMNTSFVFRAVRAKRAKYYWVAVLLHTLFNFGIVLIAQTSTLLATLCMVMVAAFAAFYLWRIQPPKRQPDFAPETD